MEIQSIMSLSKASVNAYLPYSKVPYKETEVSANADRCEKYRQRKAAVAAIQDMETLWKAIELFVGYVFHTATGLKYTYTVHGGELFISRKEKSVTMSTVEKAYERVVAEEFRVTTLIIGSIAKPCINQWNCSADKDLRSEDVLGQENLPHSTRLVSNRKPSPSQMRPLIFDEEWPQNKKSVLGTKRFILYFCSIIAARVSIP